MINLKKNELRNYQINKEIMFQKTNFFFSKMYWKYFP